MNRLKKIITSFLVITLVIGTGIIGSTEKSYAATACKQKMARNKTYYYDLDGDKDKDSIKQYVSNGNVYLKVNKTTKKIISNYDSEYMDYTVKIYDFNKNDKSLDIVVDNAIDDWNETRILKFKNNECKLDKKYNDATFASYDNNTGIVILEAVFCGRYEKFIDSIGCFICYEKVKINGYKAENQSTADTTSPIRKNKYKATKNLTAYTSTSGKKKAFTVSKGSTVNVYSLYQKGDTRYIKVKNKSGKYGYIKAGSCLLFTKDSCLWFR